MANQFKVSITQHIENMYGNVMDSYQQAEKDLKEYPRAFWAKESYSKYLSQKQNLEALLHHIYDGSYESAEFYINYLNPQTRFQPIKSSLNS